MRKFGVALVAAAGLTACAFSPDRMFYEVTRRTSEGLSIQVNIANMKRDAPEIAMMRQYMDDMARGECGSDVVVVDHHVASAGPYHTWMERTYRCG